MRLTHMKPASSDAIGCNRTNLTMQAGNDHDVRQDPDSGESEQAQKLIPKVSVDNDRQIVGQPALFFPPQQELTNLCVLGLLSASQPVLRGLESTGSAHGSGNGQTDAPGSLALQEPGLTPEQGSEQGTVQAALDKDYRNELSAWVMSAAPTERAVRQKAVKRIHVYLEEPAEQRRLIDLSSLSLSTLPPLPADLIALDVNANELSALPEYLPRGLQALYVRSNQLTVLPEPLLQGLQVLNVSDNALTALPKHLPQGLRALSVGGNGLSALPEHFPQGLEKLYASDNKLSALPEHLPPGLQELDVSYNELTVLPEHLPQGLQELDVGHNQLTALPENLSPGLRKLYVGYNQLTALPKNFPQNLKSLGVADCAFNSKALVALMRSNTSITELDFDQLHIDAGSEQELAAELVNNAEHPARLANAAVTLDLLSRLAFTTSDQTGALIRRDLTPNPVAGRLPEQPIPAELHDVLAENCPKDVLAVLAGMVDGTAQ